MFESPVCLMFWHWTIPVPSQTRGLDWWIGGFEPLVLVAGSHALKVRLCSEGRRVVLWMDEILQLLRNLGNDKFPCKYQQTRVPHCFLGGAGFCPSTAGLGFVTGVLGA